MSAEKSAENPFGGPRSRYIYRLAPLCDELMQPAKPTLDEYARSSAEHVMAQLLELRQVMPVPLRGDRLAASFIGTNIASAAFAAWLVRDRQSMLGAWGENHKRYLLGTAVNREADDTRMWIQKARLEAAVYGMSRQEQLLQKEREFEVVKAESFILRLTARP